ncbi:MAG: M50 family metallopeptidase [Candidatus Saccharibacteria bacterium]
MILIILLVLLVFSVLVIAHEFGHFIVAKRNGIKVYEFGVGFPPKLWGKKWRGTEYTVNLLPLGGFVRLEGEDNESKGPKSFASKSLWVKTKVLMAGVAMNTLIAWVIFTYLAATGIPQIFPFKMPSLGPITPIETTAPKLVVFQVGKDSVAEAAGITTGDSLVTINGQAFRDEAALKEFTSANAGKSVKIVYTHSGVDKTVDATLGNDPSKGILGVVAIPQTKDKYEWWAAPIAGLLIMWQAMLATVVAFFGAIATLLTQFKVAETVTGPVGVTAVFGQVVRFGMDYVLVLVASISLSLAVINALPLPALDGGRLFLLVLKRLGVPISDKSETWAHVAGFVALIALGIIIALSDISRFF